MFKKNIDIRGRHGSYTAQLVSELGIFRRNIDVYMTAPIIGFINGRKEEEDLSGDYKDFSTKIFTEQLLNESDELEAIYRLILLLDNEKQIDLDDRINRAFRDDSNKDLSEKHEMNMKHFNSYVRGGISILHEKIISDGTETDDYIKNLFDYIEDFNEMFNEELEQKLEEELKSIM